MPFVRQSVRHSVRNTLVSLYIALTLWTSFIKLYSNFLSETWLSCPDSRWRSQFKVMRFIPEFCVRSIYPEPFKRFSLNLAQMFLSVKMFAEPLNQLCMLNVKVTLQCNGNYPWSVTLTLSFRVRSISSEPTIGMIFIKLHSNAPRSQ